MAPIDLSEEPLQHLVSKLEVRNYSVLHRADRKSGLSAAVKQELCVHPHRTDLGGARLDRDKARLRKHGLILRYRTDQTDDGLEGREGTFLICSFWLVSAYTENGELDRARELCERALGYSSALDLYAEEVDTPTGRHLGNFPQAFTHLALINAVMHVIHADEQLALKQSRWAHWG